MRINARMSKLAGSLDPEGEISREDMQYKIVPKLTELEAWDCPTHVQLGCNNMSLRAHVSIIDVVLWDPEFWRTSLTSLSLSYKTDEIYRNIARVKVHEIENSKFEAIAHNLPRCPSLTRLHPQPLNLSPEP